MVQELRHDQGKWGLVAVDESVVVRPEHGRLFGRRPGPIIGEESGIGGGEPTKSKPDVSFSVDDVATAILTHGSMKAVAERLGSDVATLRERRRLRKVRQRVKELLHDVSATKLSRHLAVQQAVDEEHFKLIFDPNTAAAPKVAAIQLFHQNLARLLDSDAAFDAQLDPGGDMDEMARSMHGGQEVD
jgi:hypothetical protein